VQIGSDIPFNNLSVLTNDAAALDTHFNPLAPSDPYMGRTAQLTSRRILNTYSTNICTEYFKRAA
jgi:hypothetical protein